MKNTIRRISAILAFAIVFSLFTAFPSIGVFATDMSAFGEVGLSVDDSSVTSEDGGVLENAAVSAVYRGTDMSNGTGNYGEDNWNAYHAGKLNDGVIPTGDSTSTKGQNVEIYISGFVAGTVYVYFDLGEEKNVKEFVAYANSRSGSANRGYPTKFNVYVGNSDDFSSASLFGAADTSDEGFVRKYSASGDETGRYVILELGISSPYIVIALSEVEIYVPAGASVPSLEAPVLSSSTGTYTYTVPTVTWDAVENAVAYDVYLDGVVAAKDITECTFTPDCVTGAAYTLSVVAKSAGDEYKNSAHSNSLEFVYVDMPTDAEGNPVSKADFIIDAGHGGKDPGAVGEDGAREEADDNLKMALELGKRLSTLGFTVAYTRISDVYDSPIVKAAKGEAGDFGYYICCHRNSYTSDAAKGIETLYNPASNSSNQQFAQLVQDELNALGVFSARGIKENTGNTILKTVTMPAILAELGFISNGTDNENFDTYFNDLATAIVKGALVNASYKLGFEGAVIVNGNDYPIINGEERVIQISVPDYDLENGLVDIEFAVANGLGVSSVSVSANGGEFVELDADNSFSYLGLEGFKTPAVHYTYSIDMYGTPAGLVTLRYKLTHALEKGVIYTAEDTFLTVNINVEGQKNVMPFDITSAIYNPETGKITVEGYAKNARDQWNVALMVYANAPSPSAVFSGDIVTAKTFLYGDIKQENSNYFKVELDVYAPSLTGGVYVSGKYVTVPSVPDRIAVKTPVYFDKNAEDATDGATTELFVDMGSKLANVHNDDYPTRVGHTFNSWAVDADGTAIAGDAVVPVEGCTLYAKWDKINYTVSFLDASGNLISSQRVPYGESATPPEAPEVEGYNFAGWDVPYDNVTEDIYVVATYTIKTFTVTFLGTQGESLKTEIVSYGGKATPPEAPEVEGCDFAGWSSSVDNIKSDLIVTAQYTIKTFTVTFVGKDGEAIETQTVEYGSAATAPEAPVVEGYTFAEWDVDFSNITADTTVTAIYVINTYTVTFVGKDGNVIETQIVEYGASATAPEAPVVEGYDFTGWDKAFDNVKSDLTVTAKYLEKMPTLVYLVTFVGFNGADLGSQSVAYGAAATAPEAPAVEGYTFVEWDKAFDNITADTTVTAIYKINTYTVTFVGFDGADLGSVTVEHGSAADAPEAPAVEGYTFVEWDKAFDNITADTTVTAIYKINTYTVTFVGFDGADLGSVTVEHGSAATAPEAPAVEGYTFVEWDKAFDNITADTTVTAIYKINTYTVTFVGKDGNVIETQIVEYGASATAPEAPVVEGYDFTGWDVAFDNVKSDLTVTAKYLEKMPTLVYLVTFVGFDGADLGSQSVAYGAAATAPEAPAVEGYTFVEWDKAFDNITADTTVTAIYKINTYTVTFVGFDGADLGSVTVEHGSAADAPEAPAVEGYTFVEWDKAFDNITADTTVTAIYKINTYTVTFVGFDGADLGSVTVEHGSAATAPEAPAVEGYTFTGWDKAFDSVKSDLTVTAVYEKDGLLGDVNGDGKVNNLDATVVLKYDAGIVNEIDASVADVNGDGKVNNLDATVILKYDAGIIDEL